MKSRSTPFRNDEAWNAGGGLPFRSRRAHAEDRIIGDGQERLASLLGWAAMDVWGDMPRDIQEALFETAIKGHEADREELARLLHERHLGPCIRRSQPEAQ
jgi:hypothetical protein